MAKVVKVIELMSQIAGDASDIDWQVDRPSERERASQTSYKI
jgi:hypothetical protein